MATVKTKGEPTLMGEMFAAGLYKRNQGRRVRQWTAVGVSLLFILGAYALYNHLPDESISRGVRTGLAVGIGAAGTWFAYRLVNYRRFADFLISVQAEMDKVMWAGKKELIRSTAVVLVCMLVIGALLVVFDIFWAALFKFVGFLRL